MSEAESVRDRAVTDTEERERRTTKRDRGVRETDEQERQRSERDR